MDITIVSKNGIKIKSKLASLAVTPFFAKPKVAADAIILFDKAYKREDLNVEDNPVIFAGPGEYEIKSIKLNGVGKTTTSMYTGKIDSMDVCITKASVLANAKDQGSEFHIVLLEADAAIDQKLIVTMNPNVVIVYGEQADEVAKSLGKEVQTMAKYSITKDKLPAEMEVVLLS